MQLQLVLLSVAALVTAQSACAPAWDSTVTYSQPTLVSLSGNNYQNSWWEAAGASPAAAGDGGWKLVGPCSGTASPSPAGNCFAPWVATQAYNGGSTVSYAGKNWKNTWYEGVGVAPGTGDGGWVAQGSCVSTASSTTAAVTSSTTTTTTIPVVSSTTTTTTIPVVPSSSTTTQVTTVVPTSTTTTTTKVTTVAPTTSTTTTTTKVSTSTTTTTTSSIVPTTTSSVNVCQGVPNNAGICKDPKTLISCWGNEIVSTSACPAGLYCCKKSGNCEYLSNCPQAFTPDFPPPPTPAGKRYKFNGYWGQSSGYFTNGKYQTSLLSYCQTGHWDIIHLAFLATFTSDVATKGFIFDLDKNTYGVWDSTGGKAVEQKVIDSFLQVGKDIQACQKLGVKIGLSLGGALADVNIKAGTGTAVATWLHDTFFAGKGAVRPFGADVVLDGLDYDIETSVPPVADVIAINKYLKTNNAANPSFFITGAPQCPFPDYNIGGVLAAKDNGFDFVQVQFYNNGQCNLINPLFNFDQWVEMLGIPIYVGVPGSVPSANAGSYATPAQVQSALQVIIGDVLKPWLFGVMTWDVSSAEASGFAGSIAGLLPTLPK
ncbi:UNVERIFIED_CONTAM: Chitinase 1 [Siphonaria sp. JEL0065]|nr:Chitinase 1 [Siphonaria sp. JEL0065]